MGLRSATIRRDSLESIVATITESTMSRVHSDYEPRVLAARSLLKNDHVLAELFAPSATPLLLECFLVEWLARTPFMLGHTADWLRRAGARCIEQGMKRVGHALVAHAGRDESTLDLTTRNLRAVVRGLNARHGCRIDADSLLSARPTVTMQAYRILHEEVIKSDSPAGEIAIAYEIERARSLFDLAVLVEVQRVFGPEATLPLSALRRNAPLAVERTAFYERALAEALEQQPGSLEQLAEVGAGALDIYRHFLRECITAARERARGMAIPSSRRPPPSSEMRA
jgi:hypothetical protein